MARSVEYQGFLDSISGRKDDPLSRDEEVPATEQEVGWWKQHQVRRAIVKLRRGKATSVDCHLIETKANIILSRSARRRVKLDTR